MKRIAIIQSCYIPWRGFFDLLSRCDEYVIYDQVAYSKGHWHNRNKIKTASGPRWMTIPVATSDRLGQPIDEVEISRPWTESHLALLKQAYRGATAAHQLFPWLEMLYGRAGEMRLLTDVNELFLRSLMEKLSLPTIVKRDRDYAPTGSRSERVLSTCLAAGATHYLSGPSAKAYLDERMFEQAGIVVEWMSYGPYPAYPQLHGEFEPQVSIIDALLNGQGPEFSSIFGKPAVEAE